MEEVKRWRVTYTKHVKQKRKVYQDGFLHLFPNHKVKLYDDSEQVLDSRFLKKDEAVRCGDTLAFDSYLVDIGDSEDAYKRTADLNDQCKSKASGSKDKAEFTHARKIRNNLSSVDRNTTPGRKRIPSINVSPSQKIIREFKKNELHKYGAQQNPPTPTCDLITEWQALYTTQKTQKAKKYHDGFIRLLISGSQGRQVMLYDESRNLLEKKFLKKDDLISSGESLTLEAHLVDIGDPVGSHKHDVDLKVQSRDYNAKGKAGTLAGHQSWRHSSVDDPISNVDSSKLPQGHLARDKDTSIARGHQKDAHPGKYPDIHSLDDDKMRSRKSLPVQKPLRGVHEILSILTKPVDEKGRKAQSEQEDDPDDGGELQPRNSTLYSSNLGSVAVKLECLEDSQPINGSHTHVKQHTSSDFAEAPKLQPSKAMSDCNGSINARSTEAGGSCQVSKRSSETVPRSDEQTTSTNEASQSKRCTFGGHLTTARKRSMESKIPNEVDECPSFDLGF